MSTLLTAGVRSEFKRANAMRALMVQAIAACAGLSAQPLAYRAALAEQFELIGPYRSRGKGRGSPSRRYGNKAGKYTPHQGPQARARRLLSGGWASCHRVFGMTKAEVLASPQRLKEAA